MKRAAGIRVSVIVLAIGITASALVFRATQQEPALSETAAADGAKRASDTSQQNGQQADPTTDPSSLAAGAAVDPDAASAESARIAITDGAYSPAAVSIVRGSTVVWTNTTTAHHTITGKGTDGPRSGALAPGEVYAYMFTKIGTYAYSSRGNADIQGVITVTE